jgi:hypothetical protein
MVKKWMVMRYREESYESEQRSRHARRELRCRKRQRETRGVLCSRFRRRQHAQQRERLAGAREYVFVDGRELRVQTEGLLGVDAAAQRVEPHPRRLHRNLLCHDDDKRVILPASDARRLGQDRARRPPGRSEPERLLQGDIRVRCLPMNHAGAVAAQTRTIGWSDVTSEPTTLQVAVKSRANACAAPGMATTSLVTRTLASASSSPGLCSRASLLH